MRSSESSLIGRYQLVSDQIQPDELRALLRELTKTLDVPGDIVELGCYEGTAALFFQRVLNEADSDKRLYLYDSFEGLPRKVPQDHSGVGEQFRQGELKASKQKLIANFKHAGLRVPYIKKAWFHELAPTDLPEQISFAFLDGDFYESILDSLELVWPKLTDGAVVLVDDYQTDKLPGVKKALDQWAQSHAFSLKIEASLAMVRR